MAAPSFVRGKPYEPFDEAARVYLQHGPIELIDACFDLIRRETEWFEEVSEAAEQERLQEVLGSLEREEAEAAEIRGYDWTDLANESDSEDEAPVKKTGMFGKARAAAKAKAAKRAATKRAPKPPPPPPIDAPWRSNKPPTPVVLVVEEAPPAPDIVRQFADYEAAAEHEKAKEAGSAPAGVLPAPLVPASAEPLLTLPAESGIR